MLGPAGSPILYEMPERTAPVDSVEAGDEAAASLHYDARSPELSRWRRMQIPVIATAAAALARAIGPTLRYEVLGWQHAQRIYDARQRIIYPFWHRAIFSAMWWWRGRGIVVMHSANFDGQWAGRVIERFGYGTAAGSSSRGGLKGLAVMARALEQGRDVAFTIDGPRGPRFVAKPGPVLLARRTGCPIVAFHIALENAWTFEKSWDLFQLPQPFSRAVMILAPPIRVAHNADSVEMERKHGEMQAALDRVRHAAESWFELSPQQKELAREEWNA
jgi:hypothetical protein